ncbi:hypothetical protein R6Q59_011060 [Mikania micrantha]
MHKYVKGSKTWRKTVNAIILTGIWVLWNTCNNIIFSREHFSVEKIIQEIKILGFLWIGNRSRSLNISWNQWCDFHIVSLKN